MPEITDAHLAEWERLCREATPGPMYSQWGNTPPLPHRVWGPVEYGTLARFYKESDAVLFAAARSAMPVLIAEVRRLRAAISEHHAQKADDRCIEDDDRLYAAAGLPPCDRRVGSKEEMLTNCARFIERRCEGGGWPSYRELEAECDRLRAVAAAAREVLLIGKDMPDPGAPGWSEKLRQDAAAWVRLREAVEGLEKKVTTTERKDGE